MLEVYERRQLKSSNLHILRLQKITRLDVEQLATSLNGQLSQRVYKF